MSKSHLLKLKRELEDLKVELEVLEFSEQYKKPKNTSILVRIENSVKDVNSLLEGTPYSVKFIGNFDFGLCYKGEQKEVISFKDNNFDFMHLFAFVLCFGITGKVNAVVTDSIIKEDKLYVEFKALKPPFQITKGDYDIEVSVHKTDNDVLLDYRFYCSEFTTITNCSLNYKDLVFLKKGVSILDFIGDIHHVEEVLKTYNPTPNGVSD